MDQIRITATKREELGKRTKKIRASGALPAVLYGHNTPTQSIKIDEKDFKKAFKQAGENIIISLSVDGKAQPVLIHEVQHHYLKDHPIHVDFYAVNMDEKLRAKIPIHFEGEAPAVKATGGVLVKNLSEIEVECLPADLPQNFVIDISNLDNFEIAVRVSDIKVSDKVKIITLPDEVVVTVAAPRSEEELKALEEKPIAEDVTAVEGVVKPEETAEATAEPAAKEEKKSAKGARLPLRGTSGQGSALGGKEKE